MATKRSRKPELLQGPWRVRIAEGPEGLEAVLNECERDGYTIDDLLDLDAEAISGALRWLVLARLDDGPPDEP